MKHIKLYENFYEPINNMNGKKLMSIDDKTISAIEALGFKHTKRRGTVDYITVYKKEWKKLDKLRGQKTRFNERYFKETSIDVWQYEDEWYEVETWSKNSPEKKYQCDQLEGLIKCLKEI